VGISRGRKCRCIRADRNLWKGEINRDFREVVFCKIFIELRNNFGERCFLEVDFREIECFKGICNRIVISLCIAAQENKESKYYSGWIHICCQNVMLSFQEGREALLLVS